MVQGGLCLFTASWATLPVERVPEGSVPLVCCRAAPSPAHSCAWTCGGQAQLGQLRGLWASLFVSAALLSRGGPCGQTWTQTSALPPAGFPVCR